MPAQRGKLEARGDPAAFFCGSGAGRPPAGLGCRDPGRRFSVPEPDATTVNMHRFSMGRRSQVPAGFTLVEALVAITITAIAASALLLGISSSLQTTGDAMEQSIALGMAQQLLDEIVGTGCCCDAAAAPGGRASFKTIDDYDGFQSQPPKDCWGVVLGYDGGEDGKRHPNFLAPPRFFDRWAQRVDVSHTDDYDLVEVRILYVDPDRGTRELAKLQRGIPDVPEPE